MEKKGVRSNKHRGTIALPQRSNLVDDIMLSNKTAESRDPRNLAIPEAPTEPVYPEGGHSPNCTIVITGLPMTYDAMQLANIANWITPVIYAHRGDGYYLLTFPTNATTVTAMSILHKLIPEALGIAVSIGIRLADSPPGLGQRLLDWFSSGKPALNG